MASITSLGSDNISMLLGSLSSSSSSTGSIYDNLGTYKSIANGSYGKLLNSYYDKVGKPEWIDSTEKKDSTSKKTIKEQAAALSSIKTKADSLTSSAAELGTTGSKSLFKNKDGNTEEAVKKIQEFVTDYNDTITAAKKSSDSRTNSRVSAMINNTETYESRLSNVGITIKEDNTLSVDTDKLKKASMEELQKVFNGTGSFAATTAQRAARVGAQAAISSTSSTYTAGGTYNMTNVQSVFSGSM